MLEGAINIENNDNIMEEYGDVLFSIVNLSRFLKINPEFALTNGIEKFINRFRYIENTIVSKGLSMENISIDEMNDLWNKSKEKHN